MTTPFHNAVSLNGFHFEKYHLAFKVSGSVTAADVGKAVSLDATAPNTVKLAADGDTIIGRLETLELRQGFAGGTVGTVALHFANTLPIKTGDALAVGDTAVGAGSGEIKKAGANNANVNFVAEIIGTKAVVVKV